MIKPATRAKILERTKEIKQTLKDWATTHEEDLEYESQCFLDAAKTLDLAIKRLRGETTLTR
jgi:hypothetical protein